MIFRDKVDDDFVDCTTALPDSREAHLPAAGIASTKADRGTGVKVACVLNALP